MKLAEICVAALALLGLCGETVSKTPDLENPVMAIEFCPSNREAEVKRYLGIKGEHLLEIDELLGELDDRGVHIERLSEIWHYNDTCEARLKLDDFTIHRVIFPNELIRRPAFWIVSDPDNVVRLISTDHAYIAP